MAEAQLKFRDAQLHEALLETRGNLSAAARYLAEKWDTPCTREYVRKRVKATPELLALVERMREEHIDQAEDNIFNAVHNGDYNASVLVVRTLGKERGWVPKEERQTDIDASSLVDAIQKGRDRAREAPPSDTPSTALEDQTTNGE
jgi:hypothetical protein